MQLRRWVIERSFDWIARCRRLAHDHDAIRRQIEATGAAPNIPPKVNRLWTPCFSPVLYRGRNAIERMFGRLKDFRRIATRYDRLATNDLAAVCLAATLSYRLRVWRLELVYFSDHMFFQQ